MFEFVTRTPAETEALAAALGAALVGGERIALCGPLGAGKTCFVRGLARGLGVPPDDPVSSPTFVLVHEHVGRLTLVHVDLYRLDGQDDLESLGVEDRLAEDRSVLAAEWADRIPGEAAGFSLRVELDHEPAETERRIKILGNSPAVAGLVAALQSAASAAESLRRT